MTVFKTVAFNRSAKSPDVPLGFEPKLNGPKPFVLPLHQRTLLGDSTGIEPVARPVLGLALTY
jgi:hypothetical protein